MDFPKEIGRRIKAARRSGGMTLHDLSRATNGVLSPSRISNYEQGLRLPGPQEALILAKALTTSAARLMCLDGEVGMTEDEATVLRNWRALPEKDRNDYARRIEALAMVYREPVSDERIGAYANPHKYPPKARRSPTRSR